MRRIQPLPSSVANQIAAGEVIDRPAAVLKELLENAFDSGANNVTVEISWDVLSCIRVSDNGDGILAEDLPLAVLAHATSKIRQFEDLSSIASMGFRGEALASIASVSRMSIHSKPAEQDYAMKWSREDNTQQPLLMPVARSQGTTIEVRDLFFNAPVRKKFLKSTQIEYQAVEMVIKRFALSAPHMGLTFIYRDKTILKLAPAHSSLAKQQRIKKLLGKAFIEQSIELDIEEDGMQLNGWITDITYQRSQLDKQWVYINQRMVREKLVFHAIKQAYENVLHPGRYPGCVLYLSLDPREVDVNVHPTKHEVRFQAPRLIHDFIWTQITTALNHSKTKAVVSQVSPCVKRQVTTDFATPLGLQVSPAEKSALWAPLNFDFSILRLETGSYLIDIGVGARERKTTMIEEGETLASRPLLVPLTHDVTVVEKSALIALLPYLRPLGIDLGWIGENTIVLRTIPVIFPQLDIRAFLGGLATLEPSAKAIKNWLVSCHSMSAFDLSEDEKFWFIGKIKQAHAMKTLLPWCIALDEAKCRKMLYG